MTCPVLLLHGFTGRGASWQPVIDRLRAGTDVIAPDLVGHDPRGELEGDRAVTCFDDEVDRLAALVATRGRVLLAGYSLGARVALGLLARHPEKVGAAALVGARPGLGEHRARRARRRDDEALARMLERDGITAFAERWQALPLFATQARLPAAVLARQRRQRLAHRPAGLAHALRVLGLGAMPDRTGVLATVAQPVTLLLGALDLAFEAPTRVLAAGLPAASVVRVADAGHNLVLEAPGAVAAAIDALQEAA